MRQCFLSREWVAKDYEEVNINTEKNCVREKRSLHIKIIFVLIRFACVRRVGISAFDLGFILRQCHKCDCWRLRNLLA